jgi:regulatory protein
VGEDDGAEALDHADNEAASAALRFAERRRIGPFALAPPSDPKQRDKQLAAMVRAGHSFSISQAILRLSPGAEFDLEELAEQR